MVQLHSQALGGRRRRRRGVEQDKDGEKQWAVRVAINHKKDDKKVTQVGVKEQVKARDKTDDDWGRLLCQNAPAMLKTPDASDCM
uniref:Uncharacterized protein n=1 Tax=Knipowitschia caucasica TaxID=637954 RepID=A0AAV2JL05_KNICA